MSALIDEDGGGLPGCLTLPSQAREAVPRCSPGAASTPGASGGDAVKRSSIVAYRASAGNCPLPGNVAVKK